MPPFAAHRRDAGHISRWVAALLVTSIAAAGCQYNWLQFGGGPAHSGAATAEQTITAANVSGLRRVWQATLPVYADGAPAVLLGVTLADARQHTLIFTTSRMGDITAIDAADGSTVWSRSFGPGSCKINNGATACYTTSSPAVDPNLQFVYSYGLDGRIHKLSVSTGTETLDANWPELVTLKGFDEKGSSALSTATDAQGNTFLYMVTAGYPGDRGDYQGHLVAVNLATGSQNVYNTLCSDQTVHFVKTPASPDCSEVQSGVWARAGTVYDADNGRLFISTGNATFAPANHNWGDTVLALRPDGTAINSAGDPVDSYTPTNYQFLDDADQDLGSTLPALLPKRSNKYPHLGVMSGKDSKLRLINLDAMGGLGVGATGGEIGALINVPQGGPVLTQPAVWTNPADNSVWVFVANNNGTTALKVQIDGGGNPSLVVKWTTATNGTSPVIARGVLYEAGSTTIGGYDPLTGAKLWSDSTIGSIHWQSPVVIEGMVLIEDNAGRLSAYAL
jgi:hypothetical protein